MSDKEIMDERRKNVLRYDRWTCKLCSELVDANTAVGSDDEKTTVLQTHIETRHNQSTDVDQSMDKKYLVLYFTPETGDIIQDNEKLI